MVMAAYERVFSIPDLNTLHESRFLGLLRTGRCSRERSSNVWCAGFQRWPSLPDDGALRTELTGSERARDTPAERTESWYFSSSKHELL